LWISKVLYGIVALEKDTKHLIRLGLGDETQTEAAFKDQTLEISEKLREVGAVCSPVLGYSAYNRCT